ncbi:rhodanese-like domain-containing protein [Bacillus sp. Marseille-P3661]|uniref:rhodanese-like domain-containing protein n=1 Tax=Bacillus sp. Marseille-P3661 TaxID=1936234 RepID=UPI000C83B0EA|nr:rhodanese-like domain-containing protein [Bacillus sp. Marseille-P3661]
MDLFINIVLFILIAWFAGTRFVPAKGIKQITTTELKGVIIEKDKQFVDVRTPGEYKANRIKAFKNIPLHELGNRLNELSIDKEVVVICQSGMRSTKASKLLKKHGFKNITNVKGGMSAW